MCDELDDQRSSNAFNDDGERTRQVLGPVIKQVANTGTQTEAQGQAHAENDNIRSDHILKRIQIEIGTKSRVVYDDDPRFIARFVAQMGGDVKKTEENESEFRISNPERHEVLGRWTERFGSWKEEAAFSQTRFFLEAVVLPSQKPRKSSKNLDWAHQHENVKTLARFKHIYQGHIYQDKNYDGIERVVNSILRGVQKQDEKTFFGGYYLNPCVVRHDGLSAESGKIFPCTFFNFPYFSLEQYRLPRRHEKRENPRDREYPVRSLLQTYYRLEVTSDRDKEQLICKLSDDEINDCIKLRGPKLSNGEARKLQLNLYVPQLWGLSITSDMLITSASISNKQLHGTQIKWLDILTNDTKSGTLAWIEIAWKGDLGDVVYFPVAYCDWWFGLVEKKHHILRTKGVEKTHWNKYQLQMESKDGESPVLMTAWNWVKTLQNVSDGNLRLDLIKQTPVHERSSMCYEEMSNQTYETHNHVSVTCESSSNFQDRSQDLSTVDRESRSDSDSSSSTSSHCLPPDEKSSRRIPFLQWPLRNYMKDELEGNPLVRLYFVLTEKVKDFVDEYVILRRQELAPSMQKEILLSALKSVQGISLHEFQKNEIKRPNTDKSANSTRSHKFRQQSENLMRAFLPMEVIFGNNRIFQFEQYVSNANDLFDLSKTQKVKSEGEDATSMRRSVEDQPVIKRYRGILILIQTLILQGCHFTEQEAEELDSAYQTIKKEIDTLHLGVYSLSSDVVANSQGDNHDGIRINQTALIDAFKELMFFHLGVCEFLLMRDAGISIPEGQRNPSNESRDSFEGLKIVPKKHVKNCSAALIRAQEDLVAEARLRPIPELGPIMNAQAMIILLLKRLSNGVFRTGTVDVLDLYRKVTEKLAIAVGDNPNQDRLMELDRATEELKIITDVLKQQEKVLDLLHQAMDPKSLGQPEAWEGSFQYKSSSINAIKKTISEKLGDCTDLTERISRLTTRNVQSIKTQKNANNRAILAFTTITILFLPLTFMTGFFGMNLKGFANQHDIHHFWKITVPVTVGIAVPALGFVLFHSISIYWRRLRRWVLTFARS